MEIWVALIVLVGTLGGASLQPFVSWLTKKREESSTEAASRTEAVSELVLAIVVLANNMFGTQAGVVRGSHYDVNKKQVALSSVLKKGEVDVERYLAGALLLLARTTSTEEAVAVANVMSSQLFRWHRGDIGLTDLKPFRVKNVDAYGSYDLHDASNWEA